MCLCVCKDQDALQESVLSSYHVGPKDGMQVIRFGSKHLYLLSQLNGPSKLQFSEENMKRLFYSGCVSMHFLNSIHISKL